MKSFLSHKSGDLVRLNNLHRDTLPAHVGIEINMIGPGFVGGRMPVDQRTVQPFGILHGGASIVLAETLGSIASWLLVSGKKGARVAGVEVGGSHVRAVSSGYVSGLCRPVHIGRTLHFWSVEIRNDNGDLCCNAKLTVSVSLPEQQGDVN